MESRKPLELFIPPGSANGDRIILKGEADQVPGQDPGDIIFKLVEVPHEKFRRAGSNLYADFEVSLSEALTGFDRILVTHLDGHGIRLSFPKFEGRILRPGTILKVIGEGMPVKGKDTKGDLYLTSKIIFPEDGWLSNPNAKQQLRSLLPVPNRSEATVKERTVKYDDHVSTHDFDADAESLSDRSDSDDSNAEHISSTCAPQ